MIKENETGIILLHKRYLLEKVLEFCALADADGMTK